MSKPTGVPALDPSTQRVFGRTGLRVSPLGFGGAPIGNMKTDGAVVAEILAMLLDHGVNVIDTAHAYFGSEEAIGAAVGARRDDYVLVSKCGSKFTDDDLPPAWTPEYIRATIDRSLRRLRTDHIDVMLLQIALRFTLAMPGVHTAIVGTTNPTSVAANLRAVTHGPLPDAAVEIIRAAYGNADPDSAWPGLT